MRGKTMPKHKTKTFICTGCNIRTAKVDGVKTGRIWRCKVCAGERSKSISSLQPTNHQGEGGPRYL